MADVLVVLIALFNAGVTFFIWALGVGGGAQWHIAGYVLLLINIVAIIASGYLLGRREQKPYAIGVSLCVVPFELVLMYVGSFFV